MSRSKLLGSAQTAKSSFPIHATDKQPDAYEQKNPTTRPMRRNPRRKQLNMDNETLTSQLGFDRNL